MRSRVGFVFLQRDTVGPKTFAAGEERFVVILSKLKTFRKLNNKFLLKILSYLKNSPSGICRKLFF